MYQDEAILVRFSTAILHDRSIKILITFGHCSRFNQKLKTGCYSREPNEGVFYEHFSDHHTIQLFSAYLFQV